MNPAQINETPQEKSLYSRVIQGVKQVGLGVLCIYALHSPTHAEDSGEESWEAKQFQGLPALIEKIGGEDKKISFSEFYQENRKGLSKAVRVKTHAKEGKYGTRLCDEFNLMLTEKLLKGYFGDLDLNKDQYLDLQDKRLYEAGGRK